MAALQPILTVSDIPPGSTSPPTVTTVPYVVSASIGWSLGAPEQISYRATGKETVHLTPGVAPSGTRIIGISLDNGATIDSRMLSGGAEVVYDEPPYVAESGAGLGAVLAGSRIGRASFQQVSLGDILTAAAGQIRTTSGATLLPTTRIPVSAGIGAAPIGQDGTTQATALAFTYVVDPAVSGLPLDADANRDSRLRALETAVAHLGGSADPFRAHFVIDSGAMTVTVGGKGTAPRCTFDGISAGNVPQMVLRSSRAQAATKDMLRSCSLTGGSTHHGMPDGGRITAIKTTNRNRLVDTGDPVQGVPMVGIYTDKDHGGVYAWIGDDALHPVSQAFGVTDLWYDETTGIITAATDAGAYQAWATNPLDASSVTWNRLGKMALAVSKLCKSQGVLYALATFHDGSTHILRYPAVAGATTGHGYDGWSIATALTGIADFGVAEGVLYYISSKAGGAAVVHRYVLGTPGSGTRLVVPNQGTPGDTVAVGIDVVTLNDNGADVTGLYVRTTAGGKGLYFINPFAAPALYPAFAGLVEDNGQPVQVNRITAHCGLAPGFVATQNLVAWDDGQQTHVEVWAATNRGVYASLQGVGFFAWRRTDGQSNLGDVDIQIVAANPPRRILGQLQTHVYAVTPQELYHSADGTLHFVPKLSQNLNAGPAFWALWLQQYHQYPTTSDTDLPVGSFVIRRQLDGLGHVEYIGVNPASTAPAWAHHDGEDAQISTAALAPEIPLSHLLINGMARILAYTAAPQEVIEVESAFDDTADVLRTLRPTQMVLLSAELSMCPLGSDIDPIIFATWTNKPMYVLSHTITVDANEAGIARTRTRLGTLLVDDRSDPMRAEIDISFALSRQVLYGSK